MIRNDVAAWGEQYRAWRARRVENGDAESNGEPLPYDWGDLDDEGVDLAHWIADIVGEDIPPDRKDPPE